MRSIQRVQRVVVRLMIALAALAALGASYQVVATKLDQRTHPPPGRRVDVGGHFLHVHCVGAGHPTVILEAALPGGSAHWGWVQPQVASVTRVCAYDRAGMGWSDAGPRPRDARQIVRELHALLEKAQIDGPYVLVGHSFGGLYARVYSATYPEAAAGVVLVDSSHPDQWTRLPAEAVAGAIPGERLLAIAPLLAGLGLTRALSFFPVDPNLPAPQQVAIKSFHATTQFVTANVGELLAIKASSAQAGTAGSLGTKPLIVVTAAHSFTELPTELATRTGQVWVELQKELASLSSNALHRVADGATHTSLVFRLSDARWTIEAILQVVKAVRTQQPLVQ